MRFWWIHVNFIQIFISFIAQFITIESKEMSFSNKNNIKHYIVFAYWNVISSLSNICVPMAHTRWGRREGKISCHLLRTHNVSGVYWLIYKYCVIWSYSYVFAVDTEFYWTAKEAKGLVTCPKSTLSINEHRLVWFINWGFDCCFVNVFH